MRRIDFRYLPMDHIDISLSNVRRANLQEGIDELASSIDEIELQQPIVVFQKQDRYELIIGQRRFLACEKLGFTEIPALITAVRNDLDAAIRSFSENIHRLDLEYRDKMRVATDLLGKLGSVESVARRLGVSNQTVRNYLGYAAVPESIKEMVDKGKLSATTATRIARSIPDKDQAIKIAERIKETPRSEDRRKIIDFAKENPTKSPEEIVDEVKKRKFSKVTIDLTPVVANALALACTQYQSDAEDIATEALEEWLRKRGFIK